jgi:hypothetical protein
MEDVIIDYIIIKLIIDDSLFEISKLFPLPSNFNTFELTH